MTIISEILHPADYHFSYNILKELKSRGYDVLIAGRDEEVILELLKNSELEYVILSKKKKGLIGLFFELCIRTINFFKLHKKRRISLFFGESILTTSIVGVIFHIPRLAFTENESLGIKTKFERLFASKIYTPELFGKNLGRKHQKFKGLLQLTSLHPKYFNPESDVVERVLNVNLKTDKYFVLRFCDWSASHDIMHHGFSKLYKKKIINFLLNYGKVFVTDESADKEFEEYKLDIPKALFHHILAFSSLTIAETTTIPLESALLGVPCVRCTSIVESRASAAAIFDHMEEEGLIFSSSEEEKSFQKIKELVLKANKKDYWTFKRDNILKEFDDDIVKTIADLIESNL